MTTPQPPKPATRNRADVSAHTARSRRALAFLRQLADEAGYLDQGPYLEGLDAMMDEIEAGTVELLLGNAATQKKPSVDLPVYGRIFTP